MILLCRFFGFLVSSGGTFAPFVVACRKACYYPFQVVCRSYPRYINVWFAWRPFCFHALLFVLLSKIKISGIHEFVIESLCVVELFGLLVKLGGLVLASYFHCLSWDWKFNSFPKSGRENIPHYHNIFHLGEFVRCYFHMNFSASALRLMWISWQFTFTLICLICLAIMMLWSLSPGAITSSE